LFLRAAPFGRPVDLLGGARMLPFVSIDSMDLNPTGRYAAIEGPRRDPDSEPPPQPVPYWQEDSWDRRFWVLDMRTGSIRPFPGRTGDAGGNAGADFARCSMWCSAAPVLAVETTRIGAGRGTGNAVSLWNVESDKVSTVLQDPGDWTTGRDSVLDAEWDLFKTQRLIIRSSGREKWQESWHMPAGNNYDDLRAWAVSPDGARIALSTGSDIFIARRGHKLRRIPFAGAKDIYRSPDGKRLAVNRTTHPPDTVPGATGNGISVVDQATGHRRDFFEWDEGDGNDQELPRYVMTWSQHGQWLITMKAPYTIPARRSVWAFNPVTGKNVLLWQADETVGPFAWHEGSPPSP
jgi:hypothetical protein